MSNLVNICAPADAPKGAPLLFDPDAPGHCTWGDARTAEVLQQASIQAGPSFDKVAHLEQKLAQVVAHLQQLEADYQQLLKAAQLIDERVSAIRIEQRAA